MDKSDIKIYSTRNEMGKAAATMAADTITKLLTQQDSINIIVGAAPSQIEFFDNLIKQNIDFSRINAFHMDEYIGLDANAPQGFGNFLRNHLFDKVSFKSIHYINGNAENAEQECMRYETLLLNHPPDISCLGIGENGHIAFNDPPVADFNDPKLVKIVEMDMACRQQQVNDGCFKNIEDVPTHAITLTIPALMNAPYIFCVVPGASKAQAVYNTLHKDIQHRYPSTIIKKHPNAVLFLDKDSSMLLQSETITQVSAEL